jgi:hypothetical protein
MAAGSESDFQRLLNLRRQGVDPNLIRAMGPGGAEAVSGLGQQAQNVAGQAGPMARKFGQGLAARPGMYGTLGTSVAYAGSQALQGDPMGALVGGLGSLAGGAGGMGIASLASKLPLPGPLGAALRFGLPIVGGLIGGGAAEQAAGAFGAAAGAFGAKAQEAGQRPGAGPDVELGGVPLTETAATRKQLEFDRKQQLQYIQQIGGAEMALDKELYGYRMTQEVEQQKAMLPLIERMKRIQLTNAQSMLASQTAAYQQLGRQATMAKLAIGGQQERGATMRTALSQNPYMGSVLQAPNISF